MFLLNLKITEQKLFIIQIKMNKNSKILVVGSNNLISKLVYNKLKLKNYKKIKFLELTSSILYSKKKSESLFKKFKPQFVFLCGAKTGGINVNQTKPLDLMLNNLVVEIILIPIAHKYKVKKLMYLGSSCMYPRSIDKNAIPELIFSDYLEKTNLHYATSKITGMVLCDAYNKQYKTNFFTAIPSNYFGPGEDFSLENSHVIPALIKKIHSAKISNKKEVEVWGSGKPIRDFIFIDDLVEAIIFLMKNYSLNSVINISSNQCYSIKTLALILQKIIGYKGKIKFNRSKPDGAPIKTLNNKQIKQLGWSNSYSFEDSLKITYNWYKDKLN